MHAPPQDASISFATPDTFTQYEAFLFGIPTRFGNYRAQWKGLIDQQGQLWAQGSLHGVSTTSCLKCHQSSFFGRE